MTGGDERRLLSELAQGREAAFAELYDQFGPALYRAAAALLRRREWAEDAVQQVFVALLRSQQKLAEVRDLKAYLFTSLRRAAAAIAVREGRGPAALLEDPVDRNRSNPSHFPDDELAIAKAALPAEQRQVVELKIDAGLTFGEIAELLEISPHTAASRYRYGLEKLRLSLATS